MSDFLKNNILFGGDYNPDQWDDEVLKQDIESFKRAGINLVTLPVFSWTKLEPSENVYTFEWLDHILDRLESAELHYFLATPTGAQPAWLSTRFPEVLPVDIAGRKRTHGTRVNFCVNSEKYRERAAALAGKLAERYSERKGLAGWHVANEYGTFCYCENCQRKFRLWLKNRYGSLEELNKRWNTAFWNRTLTSFEEITPPTELNDDCFLNPALQLSYQRFMTDSTAQCFENEAKILKEATPGLPVFTNIAGNIKVLDQNRMLTVMDIVGWDNYPAPDDPPSLTAMYHDIMRGLKDGSSYYVMEQSPNQQNWQPYNKIKRPGEVRSIAFQGLAHGSDSVLFFQMRQSAAGQEKFHGAVISHSGRTDTRIFREISELGAELKKLGGSITGAKTRCEAGIIMDWSNWWALENNSGPTVDMDYIKELHRYYRALYSNNIQVDFLKTTSDLAGYKVIFAPLLYMLPADTAERLIRFTENGGTLVATYMSGWADEDDRFVYGAYPGLLREVLGLWVEETDALFPDEKNGICITEGFRREGGFGEDYSSDFLCERIHPESARILGVYKDDFYKGEPCFTVNDFGKGRAYYIATRPEPAFLDALVRLLMKDCRLNVPFAVKGAVEVTIREKNNNKTFFVICQDPEGGLIDLGTESLTDRLTEKSLSGSISLRFRDVLVLEKNQPKI